MSVENVAEKDAAKRAAEKKRALWIWHGVGAGIFAVFFSLIFVGKYVSAGSVLNVLTVLTPPITLWVALMCAATALLLCAFTCAPAAPSISQVLGWALATRLLTFWSTPYFEDDFYRYLWDGYQTIIGGNPYLLAPSHFFSSDALMLNGALAPQPIAHALSALNNPDIPTIYGPALQWLFALAAQLAPGMLWPVRLLWLAADLLLVSALISHFGARRAMLYALCPLVLHEVGVAAHPDGLIGGLLFFAWLATKQQQHWRCGIWLGCAVAMKIHALLALPFLCLAVPLFGVPRAATIASLRAWTLATARVGCACVLVYFAFWLPFVFPPLGSSEAFAQAFYSFATFAREWQFNALGFGLISYFVEANTARVIAGAAMCLLWAGIVWWQLRHSTCSTHSTRSIGSASTDHARVPLVAAFGVLLLFAPVINAWYLLWLLPLAVGTRFITPWVASLVLPLSYLTYFNLGFSAGTIAGAAPTPYSLPIAIPLIEGIAIGLALCWDTRKAISRQRLHHLSASHNPKS